MHFSIWAKGSRISTEENRAAKIVVEAVRLVDDDVRVLVEEVRIVVEKIRMAVQKVVQEVRIAAEKMEEDVVMVMIGGTAGNYWRETW